MPRMLYFKTHNNPGTPYVYINIATIECVRPSADDPTKAKILYGSDRYIDVNETPEEVVAQLRLLYERDEI